MDTNPALISVLESRVQAAIEAARSIEGDSLALRAANVRLRAARLALARAKGSHTTSQWQALVAETAGKCVRCGHDHAAIGQTPCKGYIVPLALGGSNAIDNLMPLCRVCVSARGGEAIDWLARFRAEVKAGIENGA